MKSLAVICIFTATIFCTGAAIAHAGLTKIADNVYSYVDVKDASPSSSFAANAGIIVGRDGIVVVDTLISAKEAQRFIRDIRAVSDKPIRFVVNTHSHLDHSFGNSEFARLGAVIIAHENCAANLAKNGETTLRNAKDFGLTEEDMKGTKVALPMLTFRDGLEINLGDQRIRLISAVPSHTDDSILVYLPDRKVLFTGDLLFTDFHPFIGDGNIPEWIRNLDLVLALDADRIIPGHGPLSTKKDVVDMKDYLARFDKLAKELTAKSRDVKTVAAEMTKLLPAKSRAAWMIPFNLQTKYLKGNQ